MFRIYFSLLLLVLSNAAFGQTPYGNDWINYSQSYYKIKVAENGIYRIKHSDLTSLNLPLGSINPKNFQLYHKGKEISIYVSGEQDNVFDNTDYIEFYGEKNDGALDKSLYTNADAQPHDYYSLFTDTAAYFLTWNNTAGKRVQNFNASASGLNAKPFVTYESLGIYPETYYQGRYLIAQMSLTDYIAGEGFLGNTYSLGGQQIRTLNTPKLYNGIGASAINFQTYVAGRSNGNSTNPGGNNHHIQIKINNGVSSVLKKDTLFSGYNIIKTGFTIAPNEFGNAIQLIYSSVNDIGASADLQAVAYAKIIYPRTTDLQGDQSLFFKTLGQETSNNTLLQFSNNTLPNPVIWDLSTNSRVLGTIGTSTSFVLSGDLKDRNAYLTDANSSKAVNVEKVEFTNFNPTSFNNDFLIITHKSLLNGAQNYAAYRTQTGYRPLIVTADQLYDQFYYGVHHPLAIKNFVAYLLNYAAGKPQYLLLLGKGYENHLIRSSAGLNADLVPTYGSPPSDDMLTARITDTGLEPAIATGRVVAKNNAEIEDYLAKLKTYESLPDSLWRKNFIHVSGGNTLSENITWSGYQNNFLNQAKGEYFGAKAMNFQKFVNQPITSNLKGKIIDEINKGAALLSFFGHGSHQATEIDFGNPNELSNENKTLIYLANGCTTGNPFLNEPSLSEKHILYPKKGAIGWIGTSSEGIASYLGNFSEIFYQKAFKTNYGQSAATAFKEAKKQYQNPGDNINIMHTTQYTWQGDPAVKFFNTSKPDYEIRNQDLFISPTNVTAVSDSFAVAMVIKNIGKALAQPLKVSITRTLPDNSTVTYPIQTFNKSIYNTDTLYFYIKSNDVKTAGINRFSVTLDPQNQYDELNENNNIATLQHNMLVNGVNLLFPKQYSIVPKTNVELVAQSNNLTIGTSEYIFEIDTIRTFNSPWKKESGVVTSGFISKWNTNLSLENNKVYYWRAKLNLAADKGGIWQEGSFTYIKDSFEGWNQSHFQQYQNINLFNIERNTANTKFQFKNSSFITSIQTRGDDASTADERTFRSNPGGRLGYIGYDFVGITILALKPPLFDPYNYPSTYNIINNEGDGTPDYYSGQYYFDTRNAVALDSLIGYLNQIPSGYPVIGFTGRNVDLSALPQNVKNAFLQIGVNKLSTVGMGEPYMFWGEKGTAAGTATEITGDPKSSIPLKGQLIKYTKEYPFPFDAGTYTTEKTGVAAKWKKAYYSLAMEVGDEAKFDLLGYDINGNQQVLMTQLPADSVDISHIDAKVYPQLAIRANLKDGTNRTPPQIKKWKFVYDELPEFSINPEIKNDFYKGIVQEGDSIRWELAIQNILQKVSDSSDVYYTLTKADRTTTRIKVGKLDELQPNAHAIFKLKLPTLGLSGINSLKMDFIPINARDTYNFNNYLQRYFTVVKDEKQPVVDVAFDGKHIINGEIVSPLPNITINLTDENSFILLKDTTVLDIYLKSANGNQKRIAYSGGLLNFTPANSASNNKSSVLFKPQKLADGVYTLSVKSKDGTGNTNTTNDYNINFEVVNESSITHFYPYPNPFTTSMRFVFTLTGDKIPDKIKVQIMTLTGKIVREVFKEELGAIRIGNNISDFRWDGTDQFGDRLANGVYFYKVIVENNDKTDIKHRGTKTDNFFKQNTGKIYLMR